MKFKVSDDIEAPIDWVWDGFTDFGAVEADARARGADLARVGDWMHAAHGVSWRGSVPVRGKVRQIEATVATFEPHTTLVIESRVGGMSCQYEVTLADLSEAVTRASVVLELKASTLSARLLL